MRLSQQMENEFDRLRRERSALDQLISKMVAFEAAMIVLARHKLMAEFATEILKINDPVVSNGER